VDETVGTCSHGPAVSEYDPGGVSVFIVHATCAQDGKRKMTEAYETDRHRFAVISTTSTGTITSFSHVAEELLRFRAEEVVGKLVPVVVQDGVDPNRRSMMLSPTPEGRSTPGFRAVVAAVEVGRPGEAEWAYVDGAGGRVPLFLSVSAVPDESGKIAGYVMVAQDLRERRRAEELLQWQAELLDLANDAIFVRDLERDKIIYWNDGAVRLYGWSSQEALGAYIHDFLKTVFPRPLTEIKQELLAKGFWAGELIHTTKDGAKITVSSRWTLLRDSHGVPNKSLELNTDITEQKRAEEALKAAHEELEQRVAERTAALSDANERLRILSRRLMEIQELERRAIARDLHDEIGQALTAIKLNLRELRELAIGLGAETQFADSLEILDQVLRHVRSLALDLRPSLLDELGLVPALRWYVGRQADRAGWEVEFCADGVTTRPSPEVEIACFRLAQEALTNVARHAEAQKVVVRLEMNQRGLTLIVRDDGKGFDPLLIRSGALAGASIGLSGMEERVKLAGGQIVIQSATAMGTEIRASFPAGAEQERIERAPQ
jgi:PAS domain S-box-containing protein